jgi:hypothetical protein
VSPAFLADRAGPMGTIGSAGAAPAESDGAPNGVVWQVWR